MVTRFFPGATFAPTVGDSWHSIYLPKLFKDVDGIFFVLHPVLEDPRLQRDKWSVYIIAVNKKVRFFSLYLLDMRPFILDFTH